MVLGWGRELMLTSLRGSFFGVAERHGVGVEQGRWCVTCVWLVLTSLCGSSSGIAEGQGVSVGGGIITNRFVWQFFWGCRRTGGLCRGDYY